MIPNVDRVANWRDRTKLLMVTAFGGSCGLCGYNRLLGALHFHHVNSAEKDVSFSVTLYRSWPTLVAEMRKCVMVCSNCHAEIHAGLIAIPKDIPRFDERYADRPHLNPKKPRPLCATG